MLSTPRVTRNNVVVKWPFEVQPYTTSEVMEYCVRDKEWQKFRLILKGVPTFKKLEMLSLRREANIKANEGRLGVFVSRRHQVQIDNYLNALKRGGQLNMNLEVTK